MMQRPRVASHHRWGIRLVSLSVVGVCWELIVWAAFVPRSLFPAPSDVALAFVAWGQTGAMFTDVATSLWRALLGYGIGAVAGVAVGMVSGRFGWVNAAISPVLQALRPIPPVAIIPLVILWVGIGDAAKISSTAYAVFFPVWVATHAGSSGVPQLYIWSAKTLGATRFRELVAVVLPAALPTIAAGLRIGVSVAFVMVFVTELAGASSGLGYQIAASQSAYRVDRMIAALVLLAASGALTDYLQVQALYRICPWLRLMEVR